jgi:fibronectin-binding autotransporter adhesin
MPNQKLVIYDSGELQKTGATQRIDIYGADFTENVAIAGTLGVSGATTLAALSATTGSFSSTLGVSGVTTLAALNANATAITGTLSTSDKATLSSLEVTNLSDLKGNLAVTGTSSLVGAVTTTAGVTVGGALAVTGTSTLTGNAALSGTLGVAGATTLATTLAVTGAATLSSTLGVTGAATLSGGLGVTGAITGSDTIAITNGGTFGSLTTAGTLNAGATTLGNTTVGTLGASGATTLSGTLGVTGATTLSSTLAVTDAATLSSTLGVTGATTLSSTLGVTGAATLSSTLGVSGATTLSTTLAVTGAATLSSTLGVTGATTLTGAVTASSTLGVTGVANFANDVNVGGDLTVNGSVISRGEVDVIIRDAFLDLAFGDFSGGVSSGGLTVSMNKAVGFTAENVSAFTAGAGATAPSFTVGGATAFAVGDIVAITLAGDAENDGLFSVKTIAGSVISIESAKIGSAPFLQNQFVTATVQTAKAYKVDLAAVAIADGANFPQSGGAGPWPKGTFITAYFPNATVSNVVSASVPQGFAAQGAWQSTGQVGLNEAYATEAYINLSGGRNLVVNKPADAGTAAIQYTSNAPSYYRTSEANLSLGVWDAAAVNAKSKIDFVANAADYDISLSSASTISAVARNVSEQAKGGAGSWKVTDAAGSGDKGELTIAQTGVVTLKSYTNNVNIDAGSNNVVAIASDTMFNSNGVNVASLGYNLSVGAGVAAKKVVAASGAAASPTVPNIMGVTLAAESSGMANVCTMHGSLVQVVSPDSFVGGDIGKVVYLVSGGNVSKTPPSNANDYVMRVGYVVALPGAATEPVIQFAPQFIAKVL